MLRSLFVRFRYLLILASLLVSVGVIVPVTSFAKPATGSQTDPTWSATGNILLTRYNFPATTLPNGKVLIEGGFAPGSYTTDSELFDPATGVWTQTGSLNQGRGEHSATLLQDGRVLVAGGYAGPVLNSAEFYDPATGTWTLTGSMSQVRTRHTATLLPNGKVLVAGGWNGDVISGAELYDPTSGSWSSAGNMLIPRAGQVAVLLPNGKVLIAGGGTLNNQSTTESELYDPNTNTWTQTGSLNVLTGGTGVLLPNGKALMAGDGTAGAELYDPATGTWTLTGSMQHARSAGLGMQALLLADGTVLIAGGDSAGTSEVYDPSTGTWDSLTNNMVTPMVTPQCGGATALLADGRALIAGGTDCASNLTAVTELNTTSTTPTPSGTWITPSDGFSVQAGTSLQLSANAYPAQANSSIQHVDFAANWSGSWQTVCTTTSSSNTFGCNWNLTDGNGTPVPNGAIRLRFTIYDSSGTSFLSPSLQGTITPPQVQQLSGSYNWSGYTVTGSQYTDVKGSWVQPTITCGKHENSLAGFWVGLDGYSSSTVEQIGTAAACKNGQINYYAWYEMAPAKPVTIFTGLKGGDHVQAEVSYQGNDKFKLSITITNTTTTWTNPLTVLTQKGAARSSAEWIAEALCQKSFFGLFCINNNWPAFGTVTFTGCSAGGISIASGPSVIEIITPKGQPSALNS